MIQDLKLRVCKPLHHDKVLDFAVGSKYGLYTSGVQGMHIWRILIHIWRIGTHLAYHLHNKQLAC